MAMATFTTTPYLVQPTADLRETYLEAMREHLQVDGAPDAGGLTMSDLEGETCLIHYTEGLRDGTALRPGTRPLEGCEWWLVEAADGGLVYLGRVSVRVHPGRRHGHVEVAVRPSRRQGHGARLLRLGWTSPTSGASPAPGWSCPRATRRRGGWSSRPRARSRTSAGASAGTACPAVEGGARQPSTVPSPQVARTATCGDGAAYAGAVMIRAGGAR